MKLEFRKSILRFRAKFMGNSKKKKLASEASVLPSTSSEFMEQVKEDEYSGLYYYVKPKKNRELSVTVQIINQKLEQVYHKLRPSTEVVLGQIHLYSVIQKQVTDLFKYVDVYAFGSVINGFGYLESDMDLTIIGFSEHQMKRTKEGLLEDLKAFLMEEQNVRDNGLSDAMLLAKTKFPLIKMHSNINGHPYFLDLGINSREGISNSLLLNCYARIDKRVRLLDMVVKEWTKLNHLFGGCKQRFNSYSLTLMVIYYLQRGIKPPILPNLHQEVMDIFNVQFNEDPFDVIKEFELKFDPEEQEMTLIELFFGFVEFYNLFDFKNEIIAIHKKENVSSGYQSDDDCTSFINIEDPCEGYNPARGVSQECFDGFKAALSRVNTSKWFNIMSNPAQFDPKTYGLDLKVFLNYFGVDVKQKDIFHDVQPDSIYSTSYPVEAHNIFLS